MTERFPKPDPREWLQDLEDRVDTIEAAPPGAGTVTSVSVTTANGVSGSVATATTTPAITLTLGAITPTSVAASGTVTGSNLSGTNTGDQTNITGNAATVTVADAGGDTTTWPLLATSQTGNMAPATDAGLTYNATTNALTATTFVGALTGNADTVTTNANLTGPITSVGNATSIASQTGTGTKFVVDTSPTIITPTIASFTNATHNHTNAAGGGTLTASALDSSVAKVGTGNTYTTGAQDFTSATSMIVPISAGYAPTANGSIGYDSTQQAWVGGGNQSQTGRFSRVISHSYGTSDTLTASVIGNTETAFSTTVTIPASSLIGNKHLRHTIVRTSTGSGGPTYTDKVRITNASGTTLISVAAATMHSATGRTETMVFDTIGTAAAGASVNTYHSIGGVAVATTPRNTTTQPVALATNGAIVLVMTITYSANTAGNSITLVSWMVEELY